MKMKTICGGIAATAAACALCATMVGCATENSGNVTSKQDDYSSVEQATIATRTVTFSALFFQDQASEDVQASLQEQGYSDVVANEDGSYTVTMTVDKYNDLVDSMHSSVIEQLDGIPNSEDWPTITAITYDEQFSNVTLTTSSSEIGLQEAFVPLQVGLVSCMYQQIAGQPVKCVVNIVDGSGAELSSSVYPDALDEAQRDSVTAN